MKGIWINREFNQQDMEYFKHRGLSIVFCFNANQLRVVRKAGLIPVVVLSRNWSREMISKVLLLQDAPYYYLDEPYEYGYPEEELMWISEEIKRKQPNAKFVIGGIRFFWDRYPLQTKGCMNVRYAYTSYIGTWRLFGKAIKFGFPSQAKTIQSIIDYGYDIEWIFCYGKDKLWSYGDEYGSLSKLQLPMIFYAGDREPYAFDDNIGHYFDAHFILNSNPYNVFTYTWKFIKDFTYRCVKFILTQDKHYFIEKKL